jgi:hypothetical protein
LEKKVQKTESAMLPHLIEAQEGSTIIADFARPAKLQTESN